MHLSNIDRISIPGVQSERNSAKEFVIMLDRILKGFCLLAGILLIVCGFAVFWLPDQGPHLIRVADSSVLGRLLPVAFVTWLLGSFILGLSLCVYKKALLWPATVCSALLVAVIFLDAYSSAEPLRPGMLLAFGLMAAIEFYALTGAAIHRNHWRKRHSA